jgi:hypothetical protein
MKRYEQIVGSLILTGFVIIILADALRRYLMYLVVLGMVLLVYRILFRDRG